jgi:hypothetical protein
VFPDPSEVATIEEAIKLILYSDIGHVPVVRDGTPM